MLLVGFSIKLSVVTSIQATVSPKVRQYLDDNQVSVTAFSEQMGITRPTLSARLSGTTRWNIKDLDQLIKIGVPIGLDIFGAALTEEGEDR